MFHFFSFHLLGTPPPPPLLALYFRFILLVGLFYAFICFLLFYINQGFRWYTRRLRMDEDGDVADEFLSEVIAQMPPTHNQIAPPKFQVKYNTRPTAMAMRKQVIVADGNVHQSLEYQGRLQWV